MGRGGQRLPMREPTDRPGRALPRRGTALALCALAALFLASARPTWVSTVDDAWVSLRYARNLALGHGLVYNAGQPPVEGYTDFLWVLLVAPGTRLPLHPAWWATGWGAAFGVVAIVCAWGLARALIGRDSPWALLPAALLAASPHFGIAATNGLETSMFVAGALGAAWATFAGARPWFAGALCGALYLVRPEGIAVGAALAGWALLFRRDARTLGWLVAVALPYFAARTAYFGALVPNTFYAQARAPFLEMWAMNRGYFGRCPELWAGGSALAALGLWRADSRRLATLAIAGGLVLVGLRVFNWMPGGRLMLAPLALAFAAAGAGLAATPRRVAVPVAAMATAWAAWLAVGPPAARERLYDAHNTVRPGRGGERLGRAIAAAAHPGDWLLVRDAGVVPYFAGPDVLVVDIHPYSLTAPWLTGKRFDAARVFALDPAFFVTTVLDESELPTAYPEERRLLRDRRIRGRFREIGTVKQHHRRFFTLWARDDREPSGVAAR